MAGERMRYVSVVLGLALLVMLGGIGVMLLGQAGPTAGPTAGNSPSPTLSAPATDQPTISPSPTAEPTAGASPTEEPTASPDAGSPSPVVSPVVSPDTSPSPPPTPSAPMREITFTGLGLDNSGSPEEMTTPRYFSFNAQGPGVVRVQLSRVTGRIRACLWQGDPGSNPDGCRTMRRGEIERQLSSEGVQRWTLSLIGTEPGTSPSATLRITFPTNDVAMRLEGFRFQGTENEGYNGFTAELRVAAAGTLDVAATFDDGEGGSHPYRLVVQEVGGGPSQPFIAEGEGSSMAQSTAVVAERSYLVRLENRELIAEALVMLSADLDWP
jgi:hypothetical protein